MENQRIRLSKTMLKNALVEIMQNKQINDITINELCLKAQINRTTFYKYYETLFDLRMDIENDCLSELEKRTIVKKESHAVNLKNLLEYIASEKKIFKVLFNQVLDKDFPEKLFSLPASKAAFENLKKSSYPPKHVEYLRLFIFHGDFAVIRKWLNDENPISLDEVVNLLLTIHLASTKSG